MERERESPDVIVVYHSTTSLVAASNRLVHCVLTLHLVVTWSFRTTTHIIVTHYSALHVGMAPKKMVALINVLAVIGQ